MVRFIIDSMLIGAGLAMDAFSVSLANGLNEPKMRRLKMCGVAGVFSVFQAAMPMIGWICVHTVLQYFSSLGKFVPWIALVLLVFIGGKMLLEGVRGGENDVKSGIGLGSLAVQGIATSIDALSVGFTIAEYDLKTAVMTAIIIAAITFIICFAGLMIGKRFGTRLSDKAQIFGGIILVAIGISIFIRGVL